MKKGDIIHNKFAGYPYCQYLIYLGGGERKAKLICYIPKVGWNKGTYDMTTKYHDGTNAFEIVGHSDFLKIAKQDLLKFVGDSNE